MTGSMHPSRIGLACSADDVDAIHRSGRLVAAIGIENGYSIGRDLGLLQRYHQRCARYFGLVHNGHNDLADSASPNTGLGDAPEEHGGLSALGETVVGELNRLGIMVDVSHSSKKSMLHAVRVSRAPVIASHSGVAAINPHPRNLDDEQLRALAANGGVVQAVALDGFVKITPAEKTAAIAALREAFGIKAISELGALGPEKRAEYDARLDDINRKWPRASVGDFVDHIDHVVRLIGIDHAGISSDFDGGGGIDGWNHSSETFNVTLELVRRGYTEAEIAKIWGGNLLRVWRRVERVADAIRSGTGVDTR
jgi:membrane dipeptidase